MKTKTLLTLIFAALVIFNVSAQNNKIVKRNIDVNSFAAISASGGWDVIIRQGNRQSVSIEVSESMLERAVVEVKNGTLHIYNKNSNQVFSWKNIRNARDIKQIAYVTVTDLNKISASGGVDVRFETPLKTTDFDLNMSGGTDLKNLSLNCNNFTGNFSGGCDADIRFLSAQNVKANASGGSDINLIDIDTQQCRVTASGGCDVKLTGKTKEFTLDASGGSDISASDFNAANCVATFSGAADGKIRVSNKLNIAVSGASDVVCYGNPADVEKNIGRSGSLKFN